MFSKGSTSFNRELPECGLSSKESRYESPTLSLSTIDKDEERGLKEDGSVTQNGPNGRLDLLGRPIPGARYRPHSERYRKLQLACYNFLERPRGVFTHLYHASICVLVIVSLILSALSTVNTDSLNYWTLLHTPVVIVEVVLVLAFLAEYCLRLWSTGCRSTYVGIKGRLKFAIQTYAILDLVVLISSICALILLATSKVASTPISLIRFLPLLRVLRFDRQGGTWKLLASVINIHRKELVTTLYLGFISLIFSSFVLYLVEKDANEKFDSWPSSFWWGIVTLTTIGYGDKTPITWYGRLCAGLFAVFGISFFALPAGILGSGFALKVTQQQRQKHFHRRRRPAAILLQSHWRMYCADINSKSVATWLPHIYYHRQGASDKIVSNSAVDSSSNNTSKKGTRKLSAVWRRSEGKSSRSQSVDAIRGSRSDSSPLVESGGSATHRGSISSTLDTGFFVTGENLHCTLVYTKKPMNTSRTFASDEANISISEDGEQAIMLTQAQKHAIRLIRLLKLNVAIRKFKEARKPYDVKDVIEQYSTGHVEMLSRMKSLQGRIDKVSNEREQSMYEDTNFKSNVSSRLMKVEHQVSVMDHKVDIILSLLTQMTGTDPKILETLPGASPPPPPPGNGQGGFGLPKVVIGSDKDIETRTRSESFPSTHFLPDNIPSWNPKHSQSDPVLKFDGTSDFLRSQCPRTPSLSSEESHDSKDMDSLSTPVTSTVSPNRILAAHGRQLSDVTEGDESVSSDSRENALDNKFSRESTLDSIEDAKEPSSPSEDVEFPIYDPLLNPYVYGEPSTTPPKDTLPIWEKKPSEMVRPRPRSHKDSSTSSFGTLVGSMENDGNSSIEVFTEGSMDKEDSSAATKSHEPSEVGSGSIDLDQTVFSSDDVRLKRRALRRCTPIEV